MSDYPAFPKISRLHREVVLTEKIDGTNGLISIVEASNLDQPIVTAGSRNRWLTPVKGDDNHGFALWVEDHADSLIHDLGPGLHYGEWWGEGIGKRYPEVAGKYFSLFNVSRWVEPFATPNLRVVPVLARTNGQDLNQVVRMTIDNLRTGGSFAAKGCMKPEGIIIFHTASNDLYKVTLEKDEEHKGKERTT